jgi:hypothetical protein
MRVIRSKRSAFTLLEMVLALVIAMLLMLALYATLNTQIMSADMGRDVLAEGSVARGILTSVSNDIVNQLGPVDPRGLAAPATTTPAPADPAATPSTTTPSTTTPSSADPVSFNVGIRGDATSLVISSYRVQKPRAVAAGVTEEKISDLRRVSIWLAKSGDSVYGIARHEIKQATAEDVDKAPTDLPNQQDRVFAKEVFDVKFQYFDGSSWQDEWDGSAPAGEDGLSVVGPPAAIRVTITLRSSMNHTRPEYNEPGSSYQQIIALPTSNNFAASMNP